ncbi:MAG: decaprenyl-phosphate phosphoribosyltransferase, partial [Candidatus Dadabacteria bacterium]|nr:decaprenyl-phosphate phosphoribosyltransferase [Candidatus Dadabacteria bacterium]NIQ17127.1 decaprenyl-phosphate phosphoribosyltransferase [Candidatus Dadabacteria bacterium]
AGYLINDLLDLENDKNHPTKKLRPLASGKVDKKTVYILIPLLFIISVVISTKLSINFLLITLIYFTISILYSINLKNIFLIDALCIASGFLLRIIAGGIASGTKISTWLYITTITLSLLLAFGKRRSELNINNSDNEFRKVLKHYNKNFLDKTIIIFAVLSIIAFSLYAFSKNTGFFYITIPFICFGMFRYIYLIRGESGSEPTETLLKDKWLFGSVFIWIILMGLIANFYNIFSFLN